MVLILYYKSLYLEFMLQLLMKNLSLVLQFNINIYILTFPKSFIYNLKIVRIYCINGLRGFFFVIADDFGYLFRTAYGSLFVLCVVVFIDPGGYGAILTEELFTGLTVIPNILKIEFALTCFTGLSFCSSENQLFGFRFSR